MLSVVILTSCSSQVESWDTAPSVGAPTPQMEMEPPAASAPRASINEADLSEDFFEDDIWGYYPDELIGAPPIITPSQAGGRMFVYTMEYNLQTVEFMSGVRTLLDMVAGHAGHTMRARIEGHDLRHPEAERHGYFEFRVPSENISNFIEELEKHFNLRRWDLVAVEETGTYQDNLFAIADARSRESRLLDELENVENERDRQAIERQLDGVQNNIRHREAAVAAIENNVIYSDVRVWLYEVIFPEEIIVPDPTFGENLGQAVNDSGIALIGVLQGILLFLIAALPVILPLLVIGFAAWIGVRIARKHMPKREESVRDDDLEE